VIEVIAQLAPGEIVSYGDVAEQAGFPGAARAVGAILARGASGTDGAELPWWRVVTAAGRLVPGHEAEHGRRPGPEGGAGPNGRVARRPVRGRRESGRVAGTDRR
jgi:methylated-DNA-protein-cysteine methyltransferase-like protein